MELVEFVILVVQLALEKQLVVYPALQDASSTMEVVGRLVQQLV
jgi:hypothetical protein